MSKAVVIGGSNGIGLAVTLELIERGYMVHILDINPPAEGYLREEMFQYTIFDMTDLDEDVIRELADDEEVKLLMITAGIGGVEKFEYIHPGLINKMMTINSVSLTKILSIFYGRIKSKDSFFTGVMGSISGFISSPMSSVYAASKAAVCRLVESINIELEVDGYDNRVLNVSPGHVEGTKFDGGEQNMGLVSNLAKEICERIEARDTLFIPEYDEIYRGILDRYHDDPHKFGMDSYQYKLDSGRSTGNKRGVVGYLSGTFDLFHVGHLNLLKKAKANCDYLIVGVHNSGKWKGKETFVDLEDRKRIVASCRYVDKVIDSCPEDCDVWPMYHYDKLFVGSDYEGTERFKRYEEYFKDKGVRIVYFPYTQSVSSTKLREKIKSKNDD